MKNYGFEYEHEGSSFVFHIVSATEAEAQARVKEMAKARCGGELQHAQRKSAREFEAADAAPPEMIQEEAMKGVEMQQSEEAERFLAGLNQDDLKVGDGADGLPVWIGIDAEAQKVYKVYANGLAQGFGDGRLVIISGLQFLGCGVVRSEQFTNGAHMILSDHTGLMAYEVAP